MSGSKRGYGRVRIALTRQPARSPQRQALRAKRNATVRLAPEQRRPKSSPPQP